MGDYTCIFCLDTEEKIKKDDWFYGENCQHLFHLSCIREYFSTIEEDNLYDILSKIKCPLCRKDLINFREYEKKCLIIQNRFNHLEDIKDNEYMYIRNILHCIEKYYTIFFFTPFIYNLLSNRIRNYYWDCIKKDLNRESYFIKNRFEKIFKVPIESNTLNGYK